jgi:hypothetical protein
LVHFLGYGVVIVKNGRRICGTGAALANAPIVQNKAYFEAKLQSSGLLEWLITFCASILLTVSVILSDYIQHTHVNFSKVEDDARNQPEVCG